MKIINASCFQLVEMCLTKFSCTVGLHILSLKCAVMLTVDPSDSKEHFYPNANIFSLNPSG